MDYKPLKKLFHMYGWDSIETEYEMRKNSYASYVTDIYKPNSRWKTDKRC